MNCPNCGTELERVYKAEVIKPHGYVAPVCYYQCDKCGYNKKEMK